jgi:hypothetical protein
MNPETLLPFDTQYFEKLKKQGTELPIQEIFAHIHQTNHWGSDDSVSGLGSDMIQTQSLSQFLPILMTELGIKTLLDAPCGDFNWLKNIHLPIQKYIGADIVSTIIEKNKSLYSTDNQSFMGLDITQDALPEADLIFCRDCLVHLSFQDIHKFLLNLKQSKITDWRTLNLEIAPFNFPRPMQLFNENCTEAEGAFADKCLGLWKVEDLSIG